MNIYEGIVVDLIEKAHVNPVQAIDKVECVYYDIYLHDSNVFVGKIDLRFNVEGDMFYYGHVGYRIIDNMRGHSYAYEACKILLLIAKDVYKMKELIITCSPENIASYKTLQKLNGEIIALVDVPKNHPLYLMNEKQKYVFKFILD